MADLLTDEGEDLVSDVFVGNTAAPTNLYIGLCSGTPGETSTLASITEESGSGYSRQQVTSWGSSSGGTVLSSTETFNATGTWQGNTHAFLTDVASGTAGNLIAVRALSATRTLVNGDSLDVDFDLTSA